jgi:hypothetical protein
MLRDPLRALRHLRIATRSIAKHGPLAERLWNVSPRRQLLTYVPLFQRFGHSIEEFYYYRLCHQDWHPHAAAFLPSLRMRAFDRLYKQVGVDIGLFRDKARFARHCSGAGLPVVPTILELDGAGEHWCAEKPGRTLSVGDVIVKPRDGLGGDGVRAFEKVPGGYRDPTGRELEAGELIDLAKRESRERPLIVQPRLRNAREMSLWSTGAICTVRLVTTRRGSDPPTLLLGLLRMPTTDSVVDNLHRGGIVATIDPSSGELGPALPLSVPDVMKRAFIETHPATRERISGGQVPCWDEIVQLGRRAHESCGGYHSIGWDIAITDEGPILVEGNVDWGVMIPQFPGPSPLGWTQLPRNIRACLDVSSGMPHRSPGPVGARPAR